MAGGWRSGLWRYSLAVLTFAVVLGTQSLLLYYSIKISFTIPMVAALLLVSWYGGRRPGLLLAVLFESVTLASNSIPPDTTLTQWAITQFSTLALLVFLVLLISGRRTIEKQIGGSELRYRTLFEYSPDGILIADPQSFYLEANETMCAMLGYTRDELVGMHASDIVAVEQIPHIDKALEVIKSDARYDREWQFRRKDGSAFTGEVTATQMADGNLLAVVRDVTERRRAAQTVLDSEERFRFLNELTKAAGSITDPAQVMAVMARMLGEHLAASRCAYADVEKDDDEFTILHDYTDGCASTVGKYHLALFGPRAVATLRAGQTLIVRNVDEELQPREGADMFNAIGIKAIITCPLIKDGHLRAMMAVHQTRPRDWKASEIEIVQDVVERCWATIELRTAEEALRQSENQFGTMANSIPQLAWMAKADGSIYWYNQRWYDYTGTSPGEMEGWGWQSVHDPKRLPEIMERWVATIATGEPFEMEFPLLGADGEFRTFLTRIEPVKDAQGNVLKWIGTNTDVEELKRTEAAVLEAKEMLEQRVSERTAQLEGANKELESFSYSVSHDLRAPLRHIDGFVQMLGKKEAGHLDPTSRRYLDVIAGAVEKMGRLIDELLAFSRTNRSEVKTVRVDLGELIAHARSELAPATAGRSIEWTIDDLPDVEGDAVLLGLVITNLLSNAIKYTRIRAEAHIAIGVADETDREVTIFVKDDGAGFDMQYADKLFGVFQRLHRDDEFEGIGIGLATVQRVIHRHGGRIWPESEVDNGACFYFTLRKAKREAV